MVERSIASAPLKTAAVVAAAGRSSRMEAFKPLLPLGDSTVIRTALDSLRAAGVSKIALVVGFRAGELKAHAAGADVVFLENADYADTDMFRSACLGLASLAGRADAHFFLPGDVPLFTARTLTRMTEAMRRSDARLVVPAFGGRRGHPILIRDGVLEDLFAYRGPGGLRGGLAATAGEALILDGDDEGVILDADTPEDYRRLLRLEAERRVSGRARG